MKKIVINGGRPLKGEVTINGAKNSVVALIPAIILADNVVTLDGVPAISDVDSLIEIMEIMGATIKRSGDCLEVDPRNIKNMPMPSGKINTSVLLFLWKFARAFWRSDSWASWRL